MSDRMNKIIEAGEAIRKDDIELGRRLERERIIALLESEDCPILMSCTDQVIALIKGDNE